MQNMPPPDTNYYTVLMVKDCHSAAVWSWPWAMVNGSCALYISSMLLTVYAKKFENPSRVWGVMERTRNTAVTFESMVRPWPLAMVNDSCTFHIVSSWWTFLPCYLKLPPRFGVMGWTQINDGQTDRQTSSMWGGVIIIMELRFLFSNTDFTSFFFFCSFCFCSQWNCKICLFLPSFMVSPVKTYISLVIYCWRKQYVFHFFSCNLLIVHTLKWKDRSG